MSEKLTLKQKIERSIELEKKIGDIETEDFGKTMELREKYLSPFEEYKFEEYSFEDLFILQLEFDAETAGKDFTNKEEYVSEKCGEDPIKKVRNDCKYPDKKPGIPILCILSAILFIGAFAWTIWGYIQMWKFNADTPIFQGLACIVMILLFIGGLNEYKRKVLKYKKDLTDFNKEKETNDKAEKEHEQWLEKVRATEKQYEIEKKEFVENRLSAYEEFKVAYEKFRKERDSFEDKCGEKTSPLYAERDTLDEELIQIIKSADDKIPESKKFGLDLFEENDEECDSFVEKLQNSLTVAYYDYLLPNLALYLKGDDMVSALLKYYKEEHEEELRQEQLRLAEEQAEAERERNQIERDRIRSFEREQAENRRQQEEFAKEEANYAAARIRCSKCVKYGSCYSVKKNKDPNAWCFRSE